MARALAIHRRLIPVYRGMFRTQGVITTKAVLNMFGLPGGVVRAPLIDASPELQKLLREDLAMAGVKGTTVLASPREDSASGREAERLMEETA